LVPRVQSLGITTDERCSRYRSRSGIPGRITHLVKRLYKLDANRIPCYLMRHKLLGVFQRGTLNPELLNLGSQLVFFRVNPTTEHR
jgi:hypothetical protein